MSSAVTVTLTLPSGKRKYYRGSTRREAEAKRDADKLLLSQGVKVSVKSTVSDVAEQWFRLKIIGRGLKPKSAESVRGALDRYILPVLGSRKINTVLPSDLDELMSDLCSYSASTQSKVVSSLRGIFGHAAANGLIPRSPALELSAAGKRPEEVTPLSDSQCAALMGALSGTRTALLCALMLYAGLRKGEAAGLMWGDVELASGILHVRRSIVWERGNQKGAINTDLKTKNARRDIPISPKLRAILEEFKRSASGSLYVLHKQDGGYLSASAFASLWDAVQRQASALNIGSVHPHQLRHTCITRWCETRLAVDEIQYLAGHATSKVTLDIYNHYRRAERLAATADKMAQEL